MAQLITDPLVGPQGDTWGACGRLVAPGDPAVLADVLGEVMADREAYAEYSKNARGRVVNFFRLSDVLDSYRQLYQELGDLSKGDVPDPFEANRVTIDLIYGDCGAGAATVWDPVEFNLATMDLIYDDLCGPPDIVEWIPHAIGSREPNPRVASVEPQSFSADDV